LKGKGTEKYFRCKSEKCFFIGYFEF
jgi:hypothetical protein